MEIWGHRCGWAADLRRTAAHDQLSKVLEHRFPCTYSEVAGSLMEGAVQSHPLSQPGPSFHLMPRAGTVLCSGAIMRARGNAPGLATGQGVTAAETAVLSLASWAGQMRPCPCLSLSMRKLEERSIWTRSEPSPWRTEGPRCLGPRVSTGGACSAGPCLW